MEEGDPEVPQEEVFAFLADARTHGTAVQRIETHCSVVFLAGARALKVKRAVRYPYLDYSTLQKRRAACEAELAINRAVAPVIYRRVGAVTLDKGGGLEIDGRGRPIEWFVDMVRFDPNAAFDVLADQGRLDDDLMDRTADVIAAMHERAAVQTDAASVAQLAAIVAQNSDLLRQLSAGILNPADVAAFCDASAGEVARLDGLLARRRREGKVRRCHGDLHLRNLCLFEGRPTPFDAIEFDERLATIDVLYDLAFLLMDLCGRNLREAANRLLNRYLERTADFGGLAALPAFLATRAAIRVHVTLAAALQQPAAKRPALDEAAQRYFTLAQSFFDRAPPRLVAIGGLSGTGKSVQARRLAPALGPAPGAVVLRSDVVRKRLAGVDFTTRLGADGYAPAITAQVYAQLAEHARIALAAGHSVIIDAVCAGASERDALHSVARALGVPFAGIWLEAPMAVRVGRVEGRRGDASDATREVAQQQEAFDVGNVHWHRIAASGTAAETAQAVRTAVVG